MYRVNNIKRDKGKRVVLYIPYVIAENITSKIIDSEY